MLPSGSSQFGDYVNFFLSQAGPSVGPTPAAAPPPTPADTLRNIFTMAAAAAAANKPQQSSMPPPAVPSRKKHHQVFKQPPLIVSNPRMIGTVPEGPIAYKEIEDTECGEKYILCGECDSLKLYRSLGSLYKHRVRGCSRNNIPKPVITDTVEELDKITAQARQVLGDKNSFLELVEQAALLGVPRGNWDSKEDVIDAIIERTVEGGGGDDDTQPVQAAIDPGNVVEELAPVAHAADIPPIDANFENYMSIFQARRMNILREYPSIPPHLLVVLLLSGECPSARLFHDAQTQCDNEQDAIREVDVQVIKKRIRTDANTTAKAVTKRPYVRRSSRLRH